MVPLVKSIDVESRLLNELGDLVIKMASTGEKFPTGRDSALPAPNSFVWRCAMFQEQEAPAWYKNPAHFLECHSGIWNRAQSERGHDAVEAVILHGYPFGGERHLFDLDTGCARPACCFRMQTRVDATEACELIRSVVREIAPGAHSNLEHSA